MEKGYEYIRADKFSFSNIPKEYIPTEKTIYFMGVFLLIGAIISAFNIPLGKMMNANEDFSIDIGYPMTFFSLNASEPEVIPIKFWGLLVDLLISLILGVAIDLIINFSTAEARKMISEERKNRPIVLKK